MSDIEAVLRDALQAGGEVLKRYSGGLEPGEIYHKHEIDLVTKADLESEERILDVIQKAFPKHAILSEEGGVVSTDSPADSPFWVIDPLDGTTNFSHGFPIYCISIACLEGGKPVVGGVYDPTRDELFIATAGGGATLNGKPISVSKIRKLKDSLLATGFPYDVRTSEENNIGYFIRFLTRTQAVRRAGSAALDLSYLACGRFDGFWELKLHPWDTAAALLIIEEAGGIVTDFSGAPFDIYGQECAASNSEELHRQILGVIASVRTGQ